MAITELACGSDARVAIARAPPMPSDFPWPDYEDPAFPFLATIDPYGHTYWSSEQLRCGLRHELERLRERLTSSEQHEHLSQVLALADRVTAEGGGHWFLTFHGD